MAWKLKDMPRAGYDGADTVAERGAGMRAKMMERWRVAQRSGPLMWVREHTGLVRRLADDTDGDEAGYAAVAKGVMLTALVMLCLGLVIRPLFWLLVPLATLALFAGLPLLCVFWWAYRDSTQRLRDRMNTREGTMGQNYASDNISPKALIRAARHAIPHDYADIRARMERGETPPASTWDMEIVRRMGIQIGVCHGVPAWVSKERGVVCFAPSRGGKSTEYVIPMVMEAPGAVITTSSRLDVVRATLGYREDGWEVPAAGKRFEGGNRCHVFDPLDIADGDETVASHLMRWDPIAECADPRMARSSAEALVSTAAISEEDKMWGRLAIDIVQALLLAAAISGGTLSDVYRWVQAGDDFAEPRRILEIKVSSMRRGGGGTRLPGALSRTPGAPSPAADAAGTADDQAALVAADWIGPLKALASEDARIASSKMLGVSGAFSALSLPDVRKRLSPAHDDPRLFDMDEFLNSRDTVYLLGDLKPVAGTTAASPAAFTAMFLNQARDHARRIAFHRPGGMLEPCLTLVLDEIANIEPWAGLPQLYSAGTGEGIWPIAFFQTMQQPEDSFGKASDDMWTNAQKIILGGLDSRKDPFGMEQVVKACGTRRVETHDVSTDPRDGILDSLLAPRSTTHSTDAPVLDANELFTLPRHQSLLLVPRLRPAIINAIPWWERGYRKPEAAAEGTR